MLKGIQSERGVFRRLEFRKLNQIAKKKARKEPYSSHTHTHTHTHTHAHTHTYTYTHTHKEMGGE